MLPALITQGATTVLLTSNTCFTPLEDNNMPFCQKYHFFWGGGGVMKATMTEMGVQEEGKECATHF